MPNKASSPEVVAQIFELLEQGLGYREIGRRLGVHNTTVMTYANRAKRTKIANDAPLTKVVPEGFHLSSVATTVDSAGTIRSQSYRAKSGDEGDVVPDNGAFPAPDGMFVRSVSTLVDGQTGAVKQQWVKSDKIKEDQFRAMLEASCRVAAEQIKPRLPVKAPTTDSDLCTLYTLTDCHVGMLAWGQETGEPWDLKIAERVLVDTLTAMLEAAPPSRVGILNQLGDFLHFDSLKPVTPEHGHLLDADSRYQKMVEVAVRILCQVIDRMLLKHDLVQVYMHEGNHDPAGSVWLRVMFARLYANEPRVKVEMSPLPYVAFRHGNTMLGFHHGHLAKKESLPLLFAARFSQMWGQTTKRYIHTGHMHHVDEKEHPGVKVIQHPTLAAADAYAARGGWLSERQATSMTYHIATGERSRGIFIPEMPESPTLH